MVAIKSGGQKRVKEGHAIHARLRCGHSSLTSFYSRHDELSEIKTTCTLPPKPPSPPSLLPTNFDNKHVCTCRNISFLLNLLATGSWYTALGQELILNKMSFSLSPDTGDKLKNNVISELQVHTKGVVDNCARNILSIAQRRLSVIMAKKKKKKKKEKSIYTL